MKTADSTVICFSTVFYAGFFPLIPGTFASLLAVFLYYFIKDNPALYYLVTFGVMFLGFLVSGRSERIFKRKDSRHIVIDEVAGMLLSFIWLPYDFRLAVIGFIIFRIMDALKPFPAGQLQNLRGSLGIMLDDIIAAIYTNIILQVVVRFASFKAI